MKNTLTNFYEKIRDAVFVSDVARSYTSLSKKGHEYIGLCPFHSEKTPSFTINNKKRFYHCFGCGAHGDVIKLESEQTNCSYKDGAYKIAEKFNIPLPTFSEEEKKEIEESDRIMSIMLDASKFYTSKLNPKIIEILTNRGIKKDIITKYNIGFTGENGELLEHFSSKKIKLDDLAKCGLVSKRSDGRYHEFFNNRIIIPIISIFGKVIGFGARSIKDEMPKYLNSPETLFFKKGETLYGENIASTNAHKMGMVILVEGYFDVITLHQFGFQNAVASLGTAVTEPQILKLWKLAPELVVCLDGDDAGVRASKKILDLALGIVSSEKKISFLVMPKNFDPDDMLNKYGKENFQRLISERLSLSEYIFIQFAKNKPHQTAEERAAIEFELDEYVKAIRDQTLAKNMRQFFKTSCWSLYNKRNFAPQSSQISNIIIQEPELERLDDLILSFVIMNIGAIDHESKMDALSVIQNSSKRGELIEYAIEFILNSEESFNQDSKILNFENNIKNTSFCQEFEILSSKYNKAIESLDVKNKSSDVLDYLLSKRYLCILMSEFKNMITLNNENIEERTQFYLNEIKSTREKINNFDTGFVQ
ncbi:MAG: DNA primase [Rickettsiaceae bacterium]|nr:DNA primase [Rickettsiaceae bacterium]